MALAIVRVLSLTTSQIKVLFTDDLDTNIGANNVSVSALLDSVPDSVVNSVVIEDNTLTANFRPIFSGVSYTVTFFGIDLQPFQTVNGESIVENGSRNTLTIISPGESQSDIRDGMLEELPVVYESEQPSLVRDIISSTAKHIQASRDVLDTIRDSNYLSASI